MPAGLTVVKVSGSLFDLPNLGQRLIDWLHTAAEVLLIPGGGVTANAIRQLDAWQHLGEEKAHWLALRSLAVNARFLAGLLPKSTVVATVDEAESMRRRGLLPILDAELFAKLDEGQPGGLPHCWQVTSDSIAARVAAVARARHLVLLKSVTIPAELDWTEAGRRGLVDQHFAVVVDQARLEVSAVNLREWQPGG